MNDSFSIAFSIGSLHVKWYSIFIFIAFLVSYCLAIYRTSKKALPTKPVENFIFILLPISIICARLWYVLGDLNQYHSIMQVLDISRGGIAIEGGVIGGIISGFIWFSFASKKYKVSLLSYADAIMPVVLIGQAFGRWGNFFNQEILGQVSHFWAFLPSFISAHLHLPWETANIVRVPLFLIESTLNVIAFLVIVFGVKNIANKFQLKGIEFFSYFLFYGIIRIILEPLRYEDYIMKIGNVPVSIILSAIFILFGFCGIVYMIFTPNKKNLSWKKITQKLRYKMIAKKSQPKVELDLVSQTSYNDNDEQMGNNELKQILED